MSLAEPPARRLRLGVAGCRYFTDPVARLAQAYEGLADILPFPCETESDRPEAHLEEPDTVLTPPVVDRVRGEAPDVIVVPPGHRGLEPGVDGARIVPVLLEPACLLEPAQGGPSAPTAVLLRPAAVPAILAAAIMGTPERFAYLPFVSVEHLRSQLALARRAGVTLAVTEPAAVPIARDAGLVARSYLDVSGGCVAVHAIERAVARAVLASLRRQAHLAVEVDVASPLESHLPSGAPPLPDVGAPDVVALRAGRRFVLVPQATITYVTSLGGVVTAFADAGRLWTSQTLAEIERRLDPSRFLRIDQSHLVNVARIGELVPWTHQRYRLLFADAAKTELVLSRDVGRRLRAAVGW